MFGRLNGRTGRRNGHVPAELPRAPSIVTITTCQGRAGHTIAETVATCFEMKLLDLDGGSEQLAGPIKETLAYLWDSPDLLQALLGSLSNGGTGPDGRPARDVLFDLASRSGVVVTGSGAGAMLRDRADAFHVLVGVACAGRPVDDDVDYHLVLDLELLPMETCIDLILAASRSHARRAARGPVPAQRPPARRPRPAPHESPDLVLERLARALQSEIGRQD